MSCLGAAQPLFDAAAVRAHQRWCAQPGRWSRFVRLERVLAPWLANFACSCTPPSPAYRVRHPFALMWENRRELSSTVHDHIERSSRLSDPRATQNLKHNPRNSALNGVKFLACEEGTKN